MATLDRTAYPRFPRVITTRDLVQQYTPAPDETQWVAGFARSGSGRLGLLVLLKAFQQLHYFPAIADVPPEITAHVASALGVKPEVVPEYRTPRTLYRHHEAIREYLGIQPAYGKVATKIAERAAQVAAEVMDQRVDVVNATIEELIFRRYELPAFSTLDRIAELAMAATQERLYEGVLRSLPRESRAFLDGLLAKDFARRQSGFQALKLLPKRASKKHLEAVLDHLAWLQTLGDVDKPLANVAVGKVRHLSHQAALLDADDLKRTPPGRRYALMLALIQRMRVRARDDLSEMFIRRVGTLHKRAQEELLSIQRRQQALTEQLIGKLDRKGLRRAEGIAA